MDVLFQVAREVCEELAMELRHYLAFAVSSLVFSVEPVEDQPGSKDEILEQNLNLLGS